MGNEAKSGIHPAVAIFFFGAHHYFGCNFSINSTHHGGFLQKKKGQHLICCSFHVTFGPNCHRARITCQNASTYRDRRLNTVVLAMLDD